MISKVDKPIFDREKEVIKLTGIVSNGLLCFGFVQKKSLMLVTLVVLVGVNSC